MDVIPVIDLKGGEVVRAQGGARHLYAPIQTPLSSTSRPADVVAGFLSLYPFRTIYVADLDAIEGRGSQTAVFAELEARFPGVGFWVDAGIAASGEAAAWLAAHRGDLVLGSESLREADLCARLPALPRCLLSLDFRGDHFQGPPRLAEDENSLALAPHRDDIGPCRKRYRARSRPVAEHWCPSRGPSRRLRCGRRTWPGGSLAFETCRVGRRARRLGHP